MIDSTDKRLTVSRQAALVSVNRTSHYRKETAYKENQLNISLMHKIDKIHTDFPTYGYRIITRMLNNQGFEINRKRVRRLMRSMGIYAIHPGPNLSKLYHAKYKMPYLLRGLDITEPDQVWGGRYYISAYG